MDPTPSSGTRKGKEPENSEEGFKINPKAFMSLYPSYKQAEAIKARIQRTVAQIPYLVAQAEEYLTQEMSNISDVYFSGICSEDPSEAHRYIEEALARMEEFYKDIGNRMRAYPRRRRAITEPGPRAPLIPAGNNSASHTGESSAMGARRHQQPRSLGVQPGEPENDPVEQGLMHPGERVMVKSVRKVTFGDTTIIPDSPPRLPMRVPDSPPRLPMRIPGSPPRHLMSIPDSTPGVPMKRSRTFSHFARALKINLGERKREKVKDLWKKVRDRLKKEDPSA